MQRINFIKTFNSDTINENTTNINFKKQVDRMKSYQTQK